MKRGGNDNVANNGVTATCGWSFTWQNGFQTDLCVLLYKPRPFDKNSGVQGLGNSYELTGVGYDKKPSKC